MKYSKAILLILDGWGIGKHDESDAVFAAKTPVMDRLMATEPNTTLLTSGVHVGLPEGQMGNSEVGHLNIGAGRVVYQMLERINQEFASNSIQDNPVLNQALTLAKKENKRIHLMGLLSNGGVHSSDEHLKNLCSIFKKHGLDEQVFIHAFLDGRDCDPNSGLGFVNDLMKDERIGKTKLASVIGRYFAMDRDKRWERVKKAYDLLVKGIGHKTKDVAKAIKNSYQNNITDEFMEPISVVEDDGKPVATIQENDIVICFNFRTDRGREITTVLTQKAFPDFGMHPLNLNYFTFTEYDKTYKNVKVFFENSDLKMTMGEHLEKLGMRQVRAAETEKYPHVTFFFSGGRETEFEGEERIMAASPKVATYDLHPEMSAFELKDRVKSRIEKEDIDFYCVNFANPDMVGHTGVFSAIKKACETVDQCVGELIDAAAKHGYKVMIIADHGNADYAVNADGSPNTAHSLNPVPIIILGDESAKEKLQNGILADVSPTLLKMMGLPQPHEMTGKPLF